MRRRRKHILLLAAVLLAAFAGLVTAAGRDFSYGSGTGGFVKLDGEYVSTSFGFSIRYPLGWSVLANEEEVGNHVTFSSRPLDDFATEPFIPLHEAKIAIYVLPNQNSQNLDDWIHELDARDPYPPVIESLERRVIGGQEARVNIENILGTNSAVAYIPYRGKVYLIMGPPIESVYASLFLEMLGTFQFEVASADVNASSF